MSYSTMTHGHSVYLSFPQEYGTHPLTAPLFEDSREVPTFCYEALSYTWGNLNMPRHIILNNKLFIVTTNLYLALRHLRLADTERILWVDAICINQSCPLEKTQQVSQMRSIYQAAKRVLVWLGEGTEEARHAMSWVASHSKDDTDDLKHLEQSVRVIMDASPENSIEIKDENLDSGELEAQDRRLHLLKGFDDLLAQPWWSRVWVIQEVVVNSDVRVLCGHSRASWATFMAFTQGISRSKPLLKAPLENTTKYQRAIERSFSRQQFACHSSQTMSDLLLQYRGFDSSDPRDNVYALLGLASNMLTSKFSPDYSKPTNEVYKHITMEIIKRHKDLTIICASQPSVTSGVNLPSWTPDWSSPWTSFCFAQVSYNACGFSTPDVNFSKDLTMLRVAGCFLGVIHSVSATYESSRPTLVDWLKRVNNWRTLIGNWDRNPKPFENDDFRQFYAHHVLGSEPSYAVDLSCQSPKKVKKRSKEDVMKFQTHVNTICRGRKLANMRPEGLDEAYINIGLNLPEGLRPRFNMPEGLVPSHAMPGDNICVLFGCRVPVVLRKSGANT